MSRFTRFFSRRMSCEEVGAVMQEYLDGELEPGDVARVLKHLVACRACGLEAAVYERIKASLHLRQLSADPVSLDHLRAFAHQLATSGPPDALR